MAIRAALVAVGVAAAPTAATLAPTRTRDDADGAAFGADATPSTVPTAAGGVPTPTTPAAVPTASPVPAPTQMPAAVPTASPVPAPTRCPRRDEIPPRADGADADADGVARPYGLRPTTPAAARSTAPTQVPATMPTAPTMPTASPVPTASTPRGASQTPRAASARAASRFPAGPIACAPGGRRPVPSDVQPGGIVPATIQGAAELAKSGPGLCLRRRVPTPARARVTARRRGVLGVVRGLRARMSGPARLGLEPQLLDDDVVRERLAHVVHAQRGRGRALQRSISTPVLWLTSPRTRRAAGARRPRPPTRTAPDSRRARPGGRTARLARAPRPSRPRPSPSRAQAPSARGSRTSRSRARATPARARRDTPQNGRASVEARRRAQRRARARAALSRLGGQANAAARERAAFGHGFRAHVDHLRDRPVAVDVAEAVRCRETARRVGAAAREQQHLRSSPLLTLPWLGALARQVALFVAIT